MANLRHAHVCYGSDEFLSAVKHILKAIEEELPVKRAEGKFSIAEELELVQKKVQAILAQPGFSKICASGELYYKVASAGHRAFKPYLASPEAFVSPIYSRQYHLVEDYRLWHLLTDSQSALQRQDMEFKTALLDICRPLVVLLDWSHSLADHKRTAREAKLTSFLPKHNFFGDRVHDVARKKPETKKLAKAETWTRKNQFYPPKSFATPSLRELETLQILNTASGKINYIVNRIKSEPDSHFLIFCDLPLISFQLENLFPLFDIKALIALKGEEDVVQRFQNDGSFQVLLMTPASGSKGLHITRANRILFVSPLWRPIDEYQASHRAARIGQTRPTEVEILCMEDSFELLLYERRKAIEADVDQATKNRALASSAQQDPFLAEALLHAADMSIRIAPSDAREAALDRICVGMADTTLFGSVKAVAIAIHGLDVPPVIEEDELRESPMLIDDSDGSESELSEMDELDEDMAEGDSTPLTSPGSDIQLESPMRRLPLADPTSPLARKSILKRPTDFPASPTKRTRFEV
jgi:hypothetical protein